MTWGACSNRIRCSCRQRYVPCRHADCRIQPCPLSMTCNRWVTNMSDMFNGCGYLETLDVSNFNTELISKFFYCSFYNCFRWITSHRQGTLLNSTICVAARNVSLTTSSEKVDRVYCVFGGKFIFNFIPFISGCSRKCVVD